MPDIPNNTTTTAVALPGAPFTSTIDYTGDGDWIAVDLVAGINYNISIGGSGDAAALLVGFDIKDANGVGLPASSGSDYFGQSSHDFMPTTSGTYYISVIGSFYLPTPAQYTLNITPTVDTVGDGIDTTATLEVGGAARSSIDTADDQDWYRIDLDAGQIYDFKIVPGSSRTSSLYDPNLVIYDSSGHVYATVDDGSGTGTGFLAHIDTTGTYYVAASLFPPGYGATTGSYELTVGIEAADNASTEINLAEDGTVNGKILWSTDKDWYRVDLQAGQTYEFYFAGQLRGIDAASDHQGISLDLTLRNSAGAPVMYDDGNGHGPGLIFSAGASGTYYIEVAGRFGPNDLGSYTLTYHSIDLAADTVAASAATTASVAVDGTFDSVLNSHADHDWVAVNLVAGHSYAFHVAGTEAAVEDGAILDLRNPDGSLAHSDSNQFGESFVATQTGVYYVDVYARPTGSDSIATIEPAGAGGAYRLAVTEDVRGDINTTATLSIDGSVSSRIDMPHDADWFRVDLVAGQLYYFSGTRTDTVDPINNLSLQLLGSAGQLAANDGNHGFIFYTPTTSGAYYIQANTVFTGDLGGYKIAVDAVDTSADSLALGTTTTGVLDDGVPLSSAVDYVGDVDWIALNVVQGQYYTLTLTGAGADTLEASRLSLLASQSGSSYYISSTLSEDGVATFTFQAVSTGSMWAAVSAPSDFGAVTELRHISPETGGYTITLAHNESYPGTDTVSANSSTTAFATIGTPFHSFIDFANDSDWIRVPVVAGQFYAFHLTSDLTFSQNITNSVQPYFASTTGDVFINLQSYQVGDYTLTVDRATPVDAIAGTPVAPINGDTFKLYFVPTAEGIQGVSSYQESVGWTAAETQAVLTAWSTIAGYANIKFEVTTDRSEADFVYQMDGGSGNDGGTTSGSGQDRHLVTFHQNGVDVFGPDLDGGALPGGEGFSNLLNLIGSTLGLRQASALGGASDGYPLGAYWLNQGVFTMMTGYDDGWLSGRALLQDVPDPIDNTTLSRTLDVYYKGFEATPMAFDIAALQRMYGAVTANAGDTTFDLSAIANNQYRAILDTGGTDTIVVSASDMNGAVIDLRAATLQYDAGGGGYVSYVRNVAGGFTIAGGSVIENATGAHGADKLVGNHVINILIGGDGDDTLVGGGGADILRGDAGSDTASYETSAAGLNVDLATPGSNTGDAAGDVWFSVENLTGSAFADTLSGDAGANILDGGHGADIMSGRGGDDTYVVDDAADVVIETAGGGNDTIRASISYVLQGEIENLTLIDQAQFAVGSALNNVITGNDVANTLDGAGGDDTMIGGRANDTYLVDSLGDVVVETSGVGQGDADTVIASVDGYTLADNVEVGRIGLANGATLSGNELSNALFGGAGADILSGALGDDTLEGGAGADLLTGGSGFDIASYAGSSSGVTAALNGVAGSGGDAQGDVLQSIEGLAGSAFDDVLTGNAGANTLNGGAGDDALYGAGGNDQLDGQAGADTMTGGTGDDSYFVDNLNDLVVENAGEGTQDTVFLNISGYTLAAGVENGVLVSNAFTFAGYTLAGNASDNVLTGTSSHDTLTGDAGNDTLDGGMRADAMTGGAGDDIYYVDDPNDKTFENAGEGYDTIVMLTGAQFYMQADIESLVAYAGVGVYVTGNQSNNYMVGSFADDTLFGDGGDDTIEGGEGDDTLGGGTGSNTLIGGAGNDTYLVENANDLIVENAGGGRDLVNVDVSVYTLGANVEDGALTGNAFYYGGTLTGNALGNVLTGGDLRDSLSGGDGDDTLAGGAQNDTVDGGAGFDIADYATTRGAVNVSLLLQGVGQNTGASGVDVLLNMEGLGGSALDDVLTGDASANLLIGRDGDDQLIGNSGDDTLSGGAGINILNGGAGIDVADYSDAGASVIVSLLVQGVSQTTHGAGNDTLIAMEGLRGSAFSDILTGDSGANVLFGLDGNDALSGGSGADTLSGDAGDDTLDGGIGADVMIGGAGNDTYVVDDFGDTTTEAPGGGFDSIVSSLDRTLGDNIENLTLIGASAIFGTGNLLQNVITGNEADNVLNGKAGGDRLDGAGGLDTLYGGDGNDTLNGGAGADFLDGGNNNDTLNGGDDGDTLYARAGNDVLDGGAGADTMYGGAGDDTYVVDNAGDLTIENSASGIDTVQASSTFSLNAFIENLTLTGAAAINGIGNILGNTLTGNDAANTLSGVAGTDTLYGMGGNDVLNGGNGNDTLYGGDGADILDGGNNDDTLWGGTGNDTLYGRTQNDTLNGEAGTDTLYGGDGNDVLNGGDDNDLVDGGNHNDTLSGGDGNDTLYGRQNDDTLNGDPGQDTLYGGDGIDHLNGGAGADILNGGNGDDVFAFSAGEANGDTLQDFHGNGAAAGDTIVFSGYGLAIDGATFVQIDATHWQINSADGLTHDVVTVSNGASFDASDYVFG